MKHNYILYALIFIVAFTFAFLGVSFPTSLAVVLLIVFVYLSITYIHPCFYTKDIKKAEQFLLNNKKTPVFYFYYSLVNQLDEDLEIALTVLKAKYKQKAKQALFTVPYALYKKDVATAKEDLSFIKHDKYKRYYEALLSISEEKLEHAKATANNLSTPWMKEVVLAQVALKEGNERLGQQHIQKALQLSKGIQKYTIWKTFEGEGIWEK